MQTPWMFIAGCTIIGYLAPEVLVAFHVRVPLGMNILSAVAFGLIAGAFV